MLQSLSNVLVHLVFSTKNRSPWLTPEIRAELHPYLIGILKKQSCGSLQVGGVEDHVHLLMRLLRTITIAQVVEHLKSGSSKWLKSRCGDFSWQGGYGAFSIAQKEAEGVIRYIQDQERHHAKTTFQEEFRKLLEDAGVEPRPRPSTWAMESRPFGPRHRAENGSYAVEIDRT